MNLENVKCVGISMQVGSAEEHVCVREYDVSDCIKYDDFVTVADLFKAVAVRSESFIILDSCCKVFGIVDIEAGTIETHLDVNFILTRLVEGVDFRKNEIFIR